MEAAGDIRLFNFDFDLLHVEPRIISTNWQVYYNDIGTFEAHFDLDSPLLGYLMDQDYLVMAQGGNRAIITSFQLGEDLSVYGRTCNWILSKRVAPPFQVTGQTAEQTARELISQAFSDVENFELGDLAGFTTPLDFGVETYTVLFDVIRDCMAGDSGGHEVFFDIANKKWVFRALKGENLSLTISEGNRNAVNIQYTQDLLDYASGGYYPYQPETPEGQQRPDPVWTYLPKDASKIGIYKWDCVLSGAAETEARTELMKKAEVREATATTQGLTCGKDYHIGDVVYLQIQKGTVRITKQKRITGVHVWNEVEDSGEEPMMEEE